MNVISFIPFLIICVVSIGILYRNFPFQEEKLYTKKYDQYSFLLLILGAGGIYGITKISGNYPNIQVPIVIIAFCMLIVAVAFAIKQIIYDYKNKRFPFQKK